VYLVAKRYLLKTSLNNQYKSGPKREIIHFEEYAHWDNRVGKGKIGELVPNHLSQKQNWQEDHKCSSEK